MKTQKMIVGTLVAGLATFFLGWGIYGILLREYMEANCDNSMSRPEDEMIWWSLILSNFIWGLLLAFVILRSASYTAASGAVSGAVLGGLAALAFDLGMYSMSTMFSDLTVVAVDTVAYTVLYAISGALTGWAMGKVGKDATT